MLYINEKDLQKIGINWTEIFDQLEQAVVCLANNDYAQPLKPYLRYRDPQNRIIAMPAFVGGRFNVSGIKWIASFPDNIAKSIPRAHSVVILNNAETGEPLCLINTALLSIIRTAGVSGVVLKRFVNLRRFKFLNVGIIGWGPIGQYHFKMCNAVCGNMIKRFYLYDLREIDQKQLDLPDRHKIRIAHNWQEVYENSDVLITCTVSKAPYIDQKPRAGVLLLNVSLRDFKPEIYEDVKKSIIVDDWEEVCREKTDIEVMHKEKGLKREDTKSIIDVVCHGCLEAYQENWPIMFNPMGMAIFDIVVGSYYYNCALQQNFGKFLEQSV
jgi:2,3-diaminopropionate biosynthesis protein SbnB